MTISVSFPCPFPKKPKFKNINNSIFNLDKLRKWKFSKENNMNFDIFSEQYMFFRNSRPWQRRV